MPFTTSGDPHIVGYIVSDCASDIDDQKSTFGFFFFHSYSPIIWSCMKQHSHTLSSIEAQHMTTVLASQEVLWF